MKNTNILLLLSLPGLLSAAAPLFAAGEIQATAPTGRVLYAEVINGSGSVWQTGNTFAAISNTTLVAQTVPLTEQGTTGIYLGSFPATITGAGTYLALVYTRSGAAAAVGDVLTGNGSLDWTGTGLASVGVSINTLATINTTTAGTNTLATGIKAKTDLVATNAMDSPNEITSQGQAGTISTAVAALPAADATAVWGATVKTITGGAVTTVTNPVALPTTVPAGYGGSTGDTPGTTTLLARLGSPVGATLAADLAAVKADTGNLVTGVAALPAAVWAYTAADGLTHQQTDALKTAILARGFAVSYTALTRTQVTTYFKADNTTVLATTTVIYDTTGRAVTRTTAFTNLP